MPPLSPINQTPEMTRITSSPIGGMAQTSAQTLTIFPRLPAEIRLLVWDHALSVSRAARIVAMDRSKPAVVGSCQLLTEAPPATASVNQESRAEALKYVHTLSVEHKQPKQKKPMTKKPMTKKPMKKKENPLFPTQFFNPYVDTLILDYPAGDGNKYKDLTKQCCKDLG